MSDSTNVLGKVLYGVVFVVGLPVLLVVWARQTESIVRLPAVSAPWPGTTLSLAGLALLVLGWVALARYGNGLPMNAFPPARYVREGIYRYLSHPVYLGFSILCAGVSVALGSASGLWLVTPLLAAGCVALVVGYEQHDLERRFGAELRRPLIALPASDDATPGAWDRLSIYLLVFVPWLLVYEAAVLAGMPADAVGAYFSFERSWPVIEWTEAIYASTYVFVLIVPLVAPTKRHLRRFAVSGLLATAIVGLLYFTVPITATPRAFEPHGFWGGLLELERAVDGYTGAAAFPAFHVVWAFIAAAALATGMPRLRRIWWGWAALVAASCLTTGMHALIDVVAGFAVFLFVARIERIWEWMRRSTERVANSWHEWRLGPVRFINHGAYAAVGSFVGVLTMGVLIGPQHLAGMFIVAVAAIIFAGLWAQVLEGGVVSMRPFGYFGSVVGAAIGGVIVGLLGGDGWLVLAALSVVAPWVQAIGRFRCLVQGCCHGSESSEALGIRYTHPRSRVVTLSTLGGVPVHPSPLYAILLNVVCGIIMVRLWFVDVPLPFIVGMYLITAGITRFVEESFRGEPQTPQFGGLAIYQWNAIISALAGIALTCVGHPAPIPEPSFELSVLGAALLVGLLSAFAYGVDFPDSRRMFARLVK